MQKKRKKKNEVIRVGDSIQVLETKFIDRVGYPLIWTDFYDIMKERKDVISALDHFCCIGSAKHQFIKAVCMGEVERQKFGGPNREIIYCEEKQSPWYDYYYKNHTFIVTGKRVVKTGKRFPGGYIDEESYENGGLEDEQTHILLQIEHYRWLEEKYVRKICSDKNQKPAK